MLFGKGFYALYGLIFDKMILLPTDRHGGPLIKALATRNVTDWELVYDSTSNHSETGAFVS